MAREQGVKHLFVPAGDATNFADIMSQEQVKRTMEMAAAGG